MCENAKRDRVSDGMVVMIMVMNDGGRVLLLRPSRRVTKTFESVFGVHVHTKRACAHFDKRAQDEQRKHQGIEQVRGVAPEGPSCN